MKISNSVREEAAKIVSTKTKSQSIFVWSFSSKRRGGQKMPSNGGKSKTRRESKEMSRDFWLNERSRVPRLQ